MKLSEYPGDPASPGIIFFPEIIDLQGLTEPVQIGQMATLERATGAQRTGLRGLLDPYIRARQFRGVNPWEYEEVANEHGSVHIKPIEDPETHQFWVVNHWRRLFDVQLRMALELSDPSMTPVVMLTRPHEGASGVLDSHAIINWLYSNLTIKRRTIGVDEVSGIERAMALLINFESEVDDSFAFIHKALRDFEDLKGVASRKPLYVVGLFAIIESLLTSKQDDTTGKSLSHQLHEKVNLLTNRFEKPLLLSNYFNNVGTADPKKVIAKLYQYRSDVAHGNIVDFSNNLQLLTNHEAVCEFLHALVRRLLLQALIEPELMRDLKRC